MKIASWSGKPVGSAVRIRSRRARVAAEEARQAIVEWRIGSDRYFGAKGLAAELWLEVFARPLQRSLADLRIKVGRLSGGSRDVPAMHRNVGQMLANRPFDGEFADPRLEHAFGAVR